MRSRRVLVLVALVTALVASTTGTVHAAAPPPVSAVQLDAQTQGPGHTWVLDFSWPASAGADSYRVAITDHDGFNTPGSHYASRNTTALSARLATDDLIPGRTYWVNVRAVNGSEDSAAETVPFTAIALDTTGPTGTFTVDRTVAFIELALDEAQPGDEEDLGFARVRVSQTSLADDTTPAAGITRKVLGGDGTPARTWTSAGPIELRYAKPGNYSPRVQLTDAAGNTTLLVLPGVQVRRDTSAPTVRIKTPANPGRVASWRRISGTSTDAGTGVLGTRMAVLLKRPDGIWYLYDAGKRRFVKGRKTLRATFESTFFTPFLIEPTKSGAWRTPWINGLGRGALHVEAYAVDKAYNDSYLAVRNQAIR